jgi:heptosyltransferase-2
VNHVIAITKERGLADIAAELRGNRYTHMLDLHDSIRSRMLRLLVPGRWRTYPKHRLARSMLIQTKRNWYRDSRSVAERYFDAARALDVVPDGHPPDLFLSPEAVREAAAWLERNAPSLNRSLIALAPGAAHATKRWPLEHWHMLVRRILDEGLAVVLVGGTEDAAVAKALAANAGAPVLNAAGQFGLQGTGALLQRASALISGDTGVMHMATALGTPVVALFGPTVQPFGYFPYTAKAQIVELPLPCRPCSSKGSSRCPLGHHRCMGDMGPDVVFEAVRRSVA